MHCGMLCYFEFRLGRCHQSFYFAFDIKEVDMAYFTAPRCRRHRTICHTRYAHWLVQTFDSAVAVFDRGIAQEHTTQLKDPHSIGFSIEIELHNLQQRSQQAGAHDTHLTGNGI